MKVFQTVREVVMGLTDDDWRFSQVKDEKWVDVYQVSYDGSDIWIKIKVEHAITGKEVVVVISFHEWDHSRPI